jgi:hypothetical protein
VPDGCWRCSTCTSSKRRPGLSELLAGALAETCSAEEEHRVVREALVAAGSIAAILRAGTHIEVEEMELFSAARFNFEEPEWDEMAGVHLAAAAVLAEGAS